MLAVPCQISHEMLISGGEVMAAGQSRSSSPSCWLMCTEANSYSHLLRYFPSTAVCPVPGLKLPPPKILERTFCPRLCHCSSKVAPKLIWLTWIQLFSCLGEQPEARRWLIGGAGIVKHSRMSCWSLAVTALALWILFACFKAKALSVFELSLFSCLVV